MPSAPRLSTTHGRPKPGVPGWLVAIAVVIVVAVAGGLVALALFVRAHR